jgi:Tol biopolymer transport system component
VARDRSRAVTALAALMPLLGMFGSAACGGAKGNPLAAETSAAAPASSTGQLVLLLDQRLVITSPDGEEHAVVHTSGSSVYPASPRWSPDGARIAYVQKTFFNGQDGTDWGDDIYVVSADGGEPQLLRAHTHTGQQVLGLAWTADGEALLFGDVEPVTSNGSIQDYTSNIARLDLSSRTESTVLEGAYEPSLSHDGQHMAYFTGFGSGGMAIGVADSDGQHSRVLIQAGTFSTLLFPRISPDGSTVSFSASARIGMAPAPGQGDHNLLRALLGPLLPEHASAHGLPMDIWRVDVATGNIERLTTLVEDDPCSAWSADGRTLVVLATGGFYEVAADGSGVMRVGSGTFGGQVDVR